MVFQKSYRPASKSPFNYSKGNDQSQYLPMSQSRNSFGKVGQAIKLYQNALLRLKPIDAKHLVPSRKPSHQQLDNSAYLSSRKHILNKHVDEYLKDLAMRLEKLSILSERNLKSKIEALAPEKQEDKDLIRKITSSHIPIVRTMPGTPKWTEFSDILRKIQTRDTICMSIDIEAWEKNPNIVTEVGISIWDPRTEDDVFSITGPQFENHHIIIEQTLPLRNNRYTPDHKFQYLLGKTKIMDLKHCQMFVQSLIDKYMVDHQLDETNTLPSTRYSRALVGHGFSGDLKWLQSLKIRVPEVPVFDTMKLFQAMYGSTGSGLGKALRLMNIPHAYMHNAGNDAYYTLNLLLYMCDIGKRKSLHLDDIALIQTKIEQWRSHDSNSQTPKNGNSSHKKTPKSMTKTEFQGTEAYPSI